MNHSRDTPDLSKASRLAAKLKRPAPTQKLFIDSLLGLTGMNQAMDIGQVADQIDDRDVLPVYHHNLACKQVILGHFAGGTSVRVVSN